MHIQKYGNRKQFPHDINAMTIHFTGIKGTGMAALAEICTFRGATITGSDVADIFYTDDVLKHLGIVPKLFDKKNITSHIDLLIYSAAYKPDSHPELSEAQNRGIPMLLYTEALGAFSQASYSCAVAGVHGKTSTTGIIGTLVKALALPAQVLAGSIISSFSDNESSAAGFCTLNIGEHFFIAETCEYKRHFMSFHPKKIILTSVESDHQDFFPTYESIQSAFVDFISLLPKGGELIYCADDKGAKETAKIISGRRSDIKLIPYGTTACGDYRVTVGDIKDGKQYFSVAVFDNIVSQEFFLQVPGVHNILNAGAACALAISLCAEQNEKIDKFDIHKKLLTGFSQFRGSRRRSEIIEHIKPVSPADKSPDILIMDDYAHHPTALKTTLEGFRRFYPGHYIIADFMSHTYTRTASLLNDFATSFSAADEVILHKIYASAREQSDSTITGRTLFEQTKNCCNAVHYFEEIENAVPYVLQRIKEINEPVLFVTMGAGDNWKLGKLLATELKTAR
ncbi:MAG: UDP-N-acetylmuramate--L-alanine ligase [Spirochaetales bacterium]